MPRKDPAARAEYARQHYLNNREDYLRRSYERRKRIQAEVVEAKQVASIGPQKPPVRSCMGCGCDITFTYNSKKGMRCVTCVQQKEAKYREANKARIAANKKAWVLANFAHKAAQDKQYAKQKPEARKAAREKWAKANRALNNALKSANRAERKKRLPAWLTEDDKWMIAEAYDLAKLRSDKFGFMWHVDHVLPLAGKKVSGLHVPTNLQVIPYRENIRKRNHYEVQV